MAFLHLIFIFHLHLSVSIPKYKCIGLSIFLWIQWSLSLPGVEVCNKKVSGTIPQVLPSGPWVAARGAAETLAILNRLNPMVKWGGFIAL